MEEAGNAPLGYRFYPTTEEILEYLACKVKGESLPYDNAMKDIDLYNVAGPEELFVVTPGEKERNEVYGFMKWKRSAGEWAEERFFRQVAGGGSWERIGGITLDGKEPLLGWIHTFKFHSKKMKESECDYILEEFRLQEQALAHAVKEFEDYVVCKIQKKPRKIELPLGFRFNPTAQELIEYLSRKALDMPLPFDGVINERDDLCNLEDPGELFEGEGEERKIVYAFTKLNKNDNTFDREVGRNSYWEPPASSQEVTGTSKYGGKYRETYFTFETKEKGNYSYDMKVFTLGEDSVFDATWEQYYAVCEINRKPAIKRPERTKSPEDA